MNYTVEPGNAFTFCTHVYTAGPRFPEPPTCKRPSTWNVNGREYCTPHARSAVFPSLYTQSLQEKGKR